MKPRATNFPALRKVEYPVHKIADAVEPYLRVIVDQFHPEQIILFGSQAYGNPTEHSDVDLLGVRRGIVNEKKSNVEIRHALWNVDAPPVSFTFISKTPEALRQKIAEHSPVFEQIVNEGVEVYAAKEDQLN